MAFSGGDQRADHPDTTPVNMRRDARGLAEFTAKLPTMLGKKAAGREATPLWAASGAFLARSMWFWKSGILLCMRSHEQGHTILAELAQAFRRVLSGITG
jgi:hypothetical protein